MKDKNHHRVREAARSGLARPPEAQGLYHPQQEHDACGVGMIADIKNRPSHEIITSGLAILANLEHRGASGADPLAGDGAGILIQTPHRFWQREAQKAGRALPEAGFYAVGAFFFPRDKSLWQAIEESCARLAQEEGIEVLFWRDVPVDNQCLSARMRAAEPAQRQLVLAAKAKFDDVDSFERRLFILRRQIEKACGEQVYISSLSARTLVYKGMFLAPQLAAYYRDLGDKAMESAMALVHQRFSTNTFPSWPLAHPYRLICHNGEINTLRGNLNWMAARGGALKGSALGSDIRQVWPVMDEGQSDSASFDNGLELLLRGGYSLAQAVMMMVPEAWDGNRLMDSRRRDFYRYHAPVMEPWDGPADIAFSDGKQIGAVLDRNGLRPARYLITHSGRLVMASEAGVLPVAEEDIKEKWRLQPGKMLLVDLEAGKIIDDEALKDQLARAKNWRQKLNREQIKLEAMPSPSPSLSYGAHFQSNVSLLRRQQAFGWTQEDWKFLLAPMAHTGQEAVGSMGNDAPLAVFSKDSKLLYNYFRQNFAQVTNPPIDPIREELVMSLGSYLGVRPSLFGGRSAGKRRLELAQPILREGEMAKIRAIGDMGDNELQSKVLDISFAATRGEQAFGWALERLQRRALKAVKQGVNLLILSDRLADDARIALPALLATSAVHHHLVRQGMRTQAGLVVETGEAREVHHMCCLAAYGAEAIHPWLALEVIARHHANREGRDEKEGEAAQARYIKALCKGMLKVMSKMGISTYQSYCGAQIVDAVGLNRDFLDQWFPGTPSMAGGAGLDEIAAETFCRHRRAFGEDHLMREALDVGGDYAYRLRGEDHVWTPEAVRDLQHAVRGKVPELYQAFADKINHAKNPMMLRSLMRIREAKEIKRKPLKLEEVEPASDIVKRFSTGAMSYGSISREAHTTLALAMNRIGGKSNTGEGGEEADRYIPLANGDSMRSAIKQVASGRFGVTGDYLLNADMIQIKMAQGAKPGEGGQLPGHKVDAVIAKVRHSTPGVGLISPPPHHDIYSIEDLAQLIFDLKNANRDADISVKLVAEIGVGTVAAGVAKARADHVTIAGHDGGTGASPLTSIKHAGSPWEIGLAETHQVLVMNQLRDRIAVQADGGLRTGRDVFIAAALGADEMGFSTAPLIAAGCLMMRKCHLNTCPVGIATQDPVLRRRFHGLPEHVINYFFFVAEELRSLMAASGFASVNALIGQRGVLDQSRAIDHWKAKGLDLSPLLAMPDAEKGVGLFKAQPQHHPIDKILDRDLIKAATPVLKGKEKAIRFTRVIHNTDRTTGTMLSSEVIRHFGAGGLAEDSIHIHFDGTAGQSFGAFLAPGISLELAGETNDYAGKGLAGGRLAVYPPKGAGYQADKSIITGNTCLYGATSGQAFFAGVAGERFAVRNSGAVAVAEGAGDHGCEYMTGGVVVILGHTGRNFAAGMSGGVAYVYDEAGDFAKRCNLAMVELEPVGEEEEAMSQFHQEGDLEAHGLVDVMSDMTRHDAQRLKQLVEAHRHYTGSVRAEAILARWDEVLKHFVKVMPVEYRRALAERAAQRGESLAARS